ncbi:hypothetical protein SVIOM74S_01978 [Streptomyces violarus]
MQPRVLQGDGQPQTRTTRGTRACRVGPPETAEHPRRLARLEPDPVIPHRDRDRTARRGELDDDIPAFTVLDGVHDEVAQHALHAPGVGLGDDGLLVAQDTDLRPLALRERLGPADHPPYDLPEVYRLRLQRRGTRVEPADLQQIREQRLEPVQLVGEQLRGPRGHRVEVLPRLVDDVRGHPHGRQRRTQLVRHVRHEPALHPRQILQLADLQLEVLRHLVEGLAEPRDVVLARDLHTFLKPPGGQPLGDPRRHPHRRDHLAHHEPGDGPQQDDDEQPGRRESPLDQAQRLLLLGEREEVVELVRVPVGVVDLLADDQARLGVLGHVVVRDAGVALRGRRAAADPLAQLGGHAPAPVHLTGGTLPTAARAVLVGGRERHHVEGALAAAGQRGDEVAHPLGDVLRGTPVRRGDIVAGAARRLVGPLLGHREPARGLALRRLHLGVQQAVAHLPDHHEAKQQDHAQRHQQRGRDDLELDVAPPQPHDGQQRPAHPPHEQPDDRAALDPALEQQPALQKPPPTRAGLLPPDRPPRAAPGPSGRRSGTVAGHVSSALPCTRRRGRSPRSPASPGPSRPWSAAAARAR